MKLSNTSKSLIIIFLLVLIGRISAIFSYKTGFQNGQQVVFSEKIERDWVFPIEDSIRYAQIVSLANRYEGFSNSGVYKQASNIYRFYAERQNFYVFLTTNGGPENIYINFCYQTGNVGRITEIPMEYIATPKPSFSVKSINFLNGIFTLEYELDNIHINKKYELECGGNTGTCGINEKKI